MIKKFKRKVVDSPKCIYFERSHPMKIASVYIEKIVIFCVMTNEGLFLYIHEMNICPIKYLLKKKLKYLLPEIRSNHFSVNLNN